jgi:hypothetical protein
MFCGMNEWKFELLAIVEVVTIGEDNSERIELWMSTSE